MIIDTLNTFANAEDVSGFGVGVTQLADVIDLGLNGRDIGNGTDSMMGVYLVVVVNTTITSGGAATVQASLVSDSVEPPATDGSETTHIQSAAFALADLNAGDVLLKTRLPLDGSNPYEQYLAVNLTVGTAALTAGAVSAFLTEQPDAWKAYAEGQNTP